MAQDPIIWMADWQPNWKQLV
uniref:Uncharacterized protein n=1 Tax=Anguilla anguilla TaxID=7936 RepID=A0A0E9PVS3_ANGAN